MKFSIDVSDRNFNKSVPIALTNKQRRMLKRHPKKGEDNCPLNLFWDYVSKNSGLTPDTVGDDCRFMVTEATYNMLRDQCSKWVLKERRYLTKDSPAHKSSLGMLMLQLAPTEIEHPQAQDNVVYYLDKLTGPLHE